MPTQRDPLGKLVKLQLILFFIDEYNRINEMMGDAES